MPKKKARSEKKHRVSNSVKLQPDPKELSNQLFVAYGELHALNAILFESKEGRVDVVHIITLLSPIKDRLGAVALSFEEMYR